MTHIKPNPRKLTLEQLREVGVFNPWEFVGADGWWLDFTAHSRQTTSSFGWCVNSRKQTCSFGWMQSGRAKPDDLRDLCEIVERFGFPYPSRWIRFMGAWVDAELYEGRMEELVGVWVELKGKESK